MRRQSIVAAAILSAVALLSCAPTVEQFQPNIQQGGRTMSLSTHPRNNNLIIAAAESGGLFITRDGGVSWKHVDSFMEHWMRDVKYAPSNPNVIVVTGDADTRTTNGGGIWRSTDGGATWYKPPTAEAPPSVRHPERLSAYGISFEPNSTNVYVGTSHGVAFSTNLGETWVYQVPDTTLPINADKTQDRVFSVLARGNGKANALGTGGVFYKTASSTVWHRCLSPGGDNWVIHGLAMSPFNPDHVFLTLYANQVFLSTDGGQNWSNIPLTGSAFSRPSFIKTARSITGNPNQFDLYYGNGLSVYRKTCIDSTPAPGLWNAWQLLTVDHADPSDMTFDILNTAPILLATDGGVHKTADHGAHWTLTGGGVKGLNALQITEVNGQIVRIPTSHTDLYFGTQDNDVWASSDRGSTWPNHLCCEGFFIGTDKYRNDETHSKVTCVRCGPCGSFVSNPHFLGVAGWPNAPGARVGSPFIISEGKYIQAAQTASSNDNIIEYTDNVGGSWTPKDTISQSLLGPPQIVFPRDLPVIYQGIRRAGLTPTGEPREGLVRIDSIAAGTPTVRDADVSGFGSLGIYPTMFAWYRVIGVNPSNPDHVIIADIQDDQMKVTTNGGFTWTPDTLLTIAVTDTGKFRFREGPFPEAHVIAFNPFHTNDILVGTDQNGVIRSTDSGRNWSKIQKTDQVTNISSFFFENATRVYVSTYGRGLWRLNLTEARTTITRPPIVRETPILIRDPRSGVAIPLHDLGNPDVCPVCIFVIVRGGEIMDIQFSRNEVKRILIDRGEVVFVDKEKNRLPSNIEISRSEKKGDFGNEEVLRKIARSGEHIRGLLLAENSIKGVITSDGDISSLLVQRHTARLRDETKPYMMLIFPSAQLGQNAIEPGEILTLVGKGYGKAGRKFSLSIGGKVLDKIIETDEKGTFEVQTPIDLASGIYKVVLRSADDGTIVAVDYINVVVRDTIEKEGK